MDVIRSLWPGVVGGADSARQAFQNEIIPQLHSGRSIETLVARKADSNETIKIIITVFLFIQGVIAILTFLTIEYTVYNLFPVLAAVEDDGAPESYEPLANKDAVELEESEGSKPVEVDEILAPRPRPTTSSLRSTYRHLRSVSGRWSLFRGGRCWMILRSATVTATFLLNRIPFLPAAVAWPIASVLTLPLYVVWTHIVITEPNHRNFWYRFPPLGLVYRAVARAALPYFLVRGFEGYIVSTVVFALVGWKPSRGSILAWLLSLIVAFIVWVCVVIPTHAIFIRVQASLLAKEERTIVPLHRSITAHRIEGKEYLFTLDAWRSFSRASWRRLFKLYAKICLFCFALEAAVVAIAVIEFLIINPIVTGK
ncbi:uncharacterized protein GGS22DRAFT_146772 [Annulohypoxylon maeteangense]|uniref:uncharacterized protein n=1 Tax=Annulohypoxylon maeteangense TaxID=1927788 RepID=UPI0020076459|nr:uncharacterized protein GGS22DRAFT_146772 [Annulohypoxylon maeteangense]KAI0884776.1 hypothetical protein GGS22DRAFT_146772 [Annulohypoxylon maeteangense]